MIEQCCIRAHQKYILGDSLTTLLSPLSFLPHYRAIQLYLASTDTLLAPLLGMGHQISLEERNQICVTALETSGRA